MVVLASGVLEVVDKVGLISCLLQQVGEKPVDMKNI